MLVGVTGLRLVPGIWQRSGKTPINGIDMEEKSSPLDRHGVFVRLECSIRRLGLKWIGQPVVVLGNGRTSRMVVVISGAQ
jgi:hypothetical protein